MACLGASKGPRAGGWSARSLLRLASGLLLLAAWPAAAAQPPAVLSGVVLDGETNAPLPGAEVRTGAATVTCGPDGRFTITLAPGETTLRIAAPGYLETTVTPEPAVLAAGPSSRSCCSATRSPRPCG